MAPRNRVRLPMKLQWRTCHAECSSVAESLKQGQSARFDVTSRMYECVGQYSYTLVHEKPTGMYRGGRVFLRRINNVVELG